MILRFGKYQGMDTADVPENYLEWLLGWPPLREPLKSAVEDELDRRESLRSKPPMKIDPQIADSIIRAGVRAMSKSHHPDLGSSHEFMTKINVTADLLREMVLGCE